MLWFFFFQPTWSERRKIFNFQAGFWKKKGERGSFVVFEIYVLMYRENERVEESTRYEKQSLHDLYCTCVSYIVYVSPLHLLLHGLLHSVCNRACLVYLRGVMSFLLNFVIWFKKKKIFGNPLCLF